MLPTFLRSLRILVYCVLVTCSGVHSGLVSRDAVTRHLHLIPLSICFFSSPRYLRRGNLAYQTAPRYDGWDV